MLEPRDLAIIMDGNGRWASQRFRPRIYGHIKGARVAKKIITECAERHLSSLTLYAFSTENWLRPDTEVNFLMRLLHRHICRERKSLVEQNIVFKTIGDIKRLPEDVQDELQKTIEATKNNDGMTLTFALSYGGRQEIVQTAKELAIAYKAGLIDEISEDLFDQTLQTYPVRGPDLIIRTSGEQRLSNFLLWQAAYSELYFTDTHWPDFSVADLNRAFEEYARRERRFGAVSTTTELRR